MGYFLAGAGVMLFGVLMGAANTRGTIKDTVAAFIDKDK